jgi:ribosome-binding protein aMBF1 (putative translation factor)
LSSDKQEDKMEMCEICGENIATDVEVCTITGTEWKVCSQCKQLNEEFEEEFDLEAFLSEDEIAELKEYGEI